MSTFYLNKSQIHIDISIESLSKKCSQNSVKSGPEVTLKTSEIQMLAFLS